MIWLLLILDYPVHLYIRHTTHILKKKKKVLDKPPWFTNRKYYTHDYTYIVQINILRLAGDVLTWRAITK